MKTISLRGSDPSSITQRGGDTDSQQILLTSQSARRAIKEQQAAALRNAILSRGDLQADTISPEEQALNDLLLQHDPLRLAVATQPIGAEGIVADIEDQGGPALAAEVSNTVPQPPTEIRIRVLPKSISDIGVGDTGDAAPIDCFAVGHYLPVRPTGAEHYVLDIGSAAHVQIQGFLMPQGVKPEFEIPRATKMDLGWGCRKIGRPWGAADLAQRSAAGFDLSETKPVTMGGRARQARG